jgi:hypothetical protein
MKISELTGAALDWAVAESSGIPIYRSGKTLSRMDVDGGIYWQPSTDWSQGGPIMEREGITVICWNKNPNQWGARRWLELNGSPSIHVYAPTPLIAAMRCYVASKLGDEIELPEELT